MLYWNIKNSSRGCCHIKINSNKCCIEIIYIFVKGAESTWINSNKCCIEIWAELWQSCCGLINSNKCCIEILKRLIRFLLRTVINSNKCCIEIQLLRRFLLLLNRLIVTSVVLKWMIRRKWTRFFLWLIVTSVVLKCDAEYVYEYNDAD